jgi:hypothetical protein
MPRPKLNSKSDNSNETSLNKPTAREVELRKLFLRTLEVRLFNAAELHILRNNKEVKKRKIRALELHQEFQTNIENLISIANRLGGAFRLNMMAATDDGLKRLQQYSSEAIKRLQKVATQRGRGRPSLANDIALLIYAALERSKKDRRTLDQIGKMIAPGGPLNNRLDKKFGPGAFDSLHLPVPNFRDDRWERTCKAAFKAGAEKFVFNGKFLSDRKSMDPKWAQQRFEKTVKEGGYSEAELLSEQDEYERSRYRRDM